MTNSPNGPNGAALRSAVLGPPLRGFGSSNVDHLARDGSMVRWAIDELNDHASTNALDDRYEWIDVQELLAHFRSVVSDEDWRLILARVSGTAWQTVASQFNCTDNAARMRFSRGMERLRQAASTWRDRTSAER